MTPIIGLSYVLLVALIVKFNAFNRLPKEGETPGN